MKEIIYKNKPATTMAEVTRRNPTFDRNRQVIEPGRVYCHLNVEGCEVFDGLNMICSATPLEVLADPSALTDQPTRTSLCSRRRRMINSETTSDAKEEISSVISIAIFNGWGTRSNAVGGQATSCGEAWMKPSSQPTHIVNLKPSRMVR